MAEVLIPLSLKGQAHESIALIRRMVGLGHTGAWLRATMGSSLSSFSLTGVSASRFRLAWPPGREDANAANMASPRHLGLLFSCSHFQYGSCPRQWSRQPCTSPHWDTLLGNAPFLGICNTSGFWTLTLAWSFRLFHWTEVSGLYSGFCSVLFLLPPLF